MKFEKTTQYIKKGKVRMTLFWDTKELMRNTRLPWNTILKDFFYDKDFPKRKLGRKWLFPAEKTKKFLLGWLEKQNG